MTAGDALKTPEERKLREEAVSKEKSKPKMGMLDSFRFLSKSKYLGYVGLVVLSYGLSMEFTEIVWKVREGRGVRQGIGKSDRQLEGQRDVAWEGLGTKLFAL